MRAIATPFLLFTALYALVCLVTPALAVLASNATLKARHTYLEDLARSAPQDTAGPPASMSSVCEGYDVLVQLLPKAAPIKVALSVAYYSSALFVQLFREASYLAYLSYANTSITRPVIAAFLSFALPTSSPASEHYEWDDKAHRPSWRSGTLALTMAFPILAGVVLSCGWSRNNRNVHAGGNEGLALASDDYRVALVRSAATPSIILVMILRRDVNGANVIVQTTRVNEQQPRLLGDAFAETSPDTAISDAQSASLLSSSSSDESFSSDEDASFDCLMDMALDTLDDALLPTGHAAIQSSGASSQMCSGIAAAAALRTIVALSEVASLAIVHSTTLLEQLVEMTSDGHALKRSDGSSRVGTADLGICDERLPALPREDEKKNPQSAWKAAAREITPCGDEHQPHECPSASIDDDTVQETLGRCMSLRGVRLEVQGRGQTTQGTAECLSARPGSRRRRGASPLYAGLATKAPICEVNGPGMALFSQRTRRYASGANESDEGDLASIEEDEAQSEPETDADDSEVVCSLLFDDEVDAIADALRALSLV